LIRLEDMKQHSSMANMVVKRTKKPDKIKKAVIEPVCDGVVIVDGAPTGCRWGMYIFL